MHRIHRGDEHAGIGDNCGESAISTDDADDLASNLSGELQGRHQVRADLFFEIAAPDGKDENCVAVVELADTKPTLEDSGPTLVVGASSQFGNVIGGGVGLDAGDFAEVVDDARGVRGAAADSEDEETALMAPGIGENGDGAVNNGCVEGVEDFRGLLDKLAAEIHAFTGG